MTTDIGTLIERVEEATLSDRWLDAAISRALAGNPTSHWYEDPASHETWINDDTCANLTGSIDAAVGLVEKARPGWRWARDENGEVSVGPMPDGWWMTGSGSTVPLAILSALLRSLQEKSHG